MTAIQTYRQALEAAAPTNARRRALDRSVRAEAWSIYQCYRIPAEGAGITEEHFGHLCALYRAAEVELRRQRWNAAA